MELTENPYFYDFINNIGVVLIATFSYPVACYFINQEFFKEPRFSKWKVLLMFVLIFNTITYLHAFSTIPGSVVFNIIRNIPIFFLFTHFYVGSSWKKAAAFVCTLYLLHLADLFLTFLLPMSEGLETHNLYGDVSGELLLYIFFILVFLIPLTLKPLKFLKEDENVPKIVWLTLILLSLNFYGIGLLIIFNHISTFVNSVLIVCVAMGWFTMMFMLNRFYSTYEKGIEDALVAQERSHYEEMYNTLNTHHEGVRLTKHDIKLHLNSLSQYLATDPERAQVYVNGLLSQIKLERVYSYSENVDFDAVINAELGGVDGLSFDVTVDISVPTESFMDAIDITALLGNLLKNAVTAAQTQETGFICVKVKHEKSMLTIVLENSYDGVVKYVGDVITTRKKKEGGLGLKQVARIVKKCDGTLDCRHDEERFRVMVCLFL